PLSSARLSRAVELGHWITYYFNIIVFNVFRFICVLHAAVVLNVSLQDMTMLKFVTMGLFDITLFMTVMTAYSILYYGFMMWFLSTYHLKHKFSEIYSKIISGIKRN